MKDAIVYPRKGRNDPSIAPVAIMVAMGKDLALMRRSMGIEARPSWGMLNSRLYKGSCNCQDVAVVGPMLGAPHAVMILEKLIVLGAQRIIFFGWCGSIQRGLALGDFLVPDRAVSEEGTSAHYPVSNPYPRPLGYVPKAIEDSLIESSIPFHKGTVWSTDAPYRETREKVILFQEQGVFAVEMELSALFTAASFRQVEIGALLVVSDELGTLNWRPGFSKRQFKASRMIAADVVRSTCEKLIA